MFVIGERLNGFIPSTKKMIEERNTEELRSIAIQQEAEGADALDICTASVNAEEETFRFMIEAVQNAVSIPLCVDSPDANMCLKAAAMCTRPGIINSVSPEGEKLDTIFSELARSEWSFIAMLTDNRGGTPDSVDDRMFALDIILKAARRHGIDESRLYIDPMVMTFATEPRAYCIFGECVHRIRLEHPRLHIVSGASNISNGLPNRRMLNRAFIFLAEKDGMDAAICSAGRMEDIVDKRICDCLRDADVSAYLELFRPNITKLDNDSRKNALEEAVLAGDAVTARSITDEALSNGESAGVLLKTMTDAMSVLGERFSRGEVFIPELILAAKAMKSAGEMIRSRMSTASESLGTVIIGTVMGDMHDIGKNLVKMMLECSGFRVIDLGTDVYPDDFVSEALQYEDTKIIALSCLLTTTMPAMRETVAMIKEEPMLSEVTVMVGGAPVTAAFACEIGADIYTQDAVECAKKARDLFSMS